MNFRTLLAAAAFMGLATGAALAQNAYTTANVNMRAGPSTQYPAVTTLPDGAAVDVHGCTTGWSWCDTTWRGIRGWVSGRYLQMLYNDRRVYLPDYAPRIGIPIITFQFGNYWDRWYRDRPWYRERDRWRPVRPDYGPPRPPRPGAGAPPPPPPGWDRPRPPRPGAGAPPPPPPGWDRPRPPRPGAGAPPPPPQGWDRPRPPRPGAGAPPPPPPGVDRPRPPRPGAGAPPPPPPGVDRPRPPRPQAEDDNRRRTGTISQGGNRTRQRGCPNGAGPDGCL